MADHGKTAVMSEAGFRTQNLLGLDVALTDSREALDVIAHRFATGAKTLLAYANTNLLSTSRGQALYERLSDECVILNDGLGLDILSSIIHGQKFPENLNGTDFTLRILERLGPDARVFCFGAKPDVIEAAVASMKARSLNIAGFCNGYVQAVDMRTRLIEDINGSSADVVLVALGNPIQEEWMLAHASRIDARLIVCVGAFFDFTAGAVYRAPLWARRMRVEWVYRLSQEPQRLWRRYTVDAFGLAIAAIRARMAART